MQKIDGKYSGESILILGAGGHGKVVAEIAADIGFVKIDFLDDISSDAIGNIHDLPEIGKQYDYIFCGIGNNQFRKKMLDEVKKLHYKIPILIHPTAYISRTAQIQPGTVVEPKAIINAGSKIGTGCIISVGAIIDHDVSIGNYVHINAGYVVKAGSTIMDFEKHDVVSQNN